MPYLKKTSSYLNCHKRIFAGEGPYDMPIVQPCRLDLSAVQKLKVIDFNKAHNTRDTKRRLDDKILHFYSDDYVFARVWNYPDDYLNMFKKFMAVMSPGFSMYVDFPVAVQIFNAFRRKWCAAYWQEHGVTVIPTIQWSDERSFDWCFDGDPVGGVVSVSSVGTQKREETKRGFLAGYNEMLRRLSPDTILFYGIVPPECEGNIIHVESDPYRMKKRLEEAIADEAELMGED